MKLDLETIVPYARGCTVLGGGGGGGDTGLALEIARYDIAAYGPIEVVDVHDLPDDTLVMPCAFTGSPLIAAEKLWNGDESIWLREQVEAISGRNVGALMLAEIGGVNGLMPLGWSSVLGLPLIDADLMGRAFPQLQQTSTRLHGVAGSPAVVTDELASTVVVRAEDDSRLEAIVRETVGALGGWCGLTLAPMDASTARDAAIQGSISRALRIGRAIDTPGSDPVGAVLEATSGTLLARGRIDDLELIADRVWIAGSAVVRPESGEGRSVRVEFRNENVVAIEDGLVIASVPDVIALLDVHTGLPIPVDRYRFGQQVAVTVFEADAIWSTEAGLEVAGPRCFGVDVDPVIVTRGIARV